MHARHRETIGTEPRTVKQRELTSYAPSTGRR